MGKIWRYALGRDSSHRRNGALLFGPIAFLLNEVGGTYKKPICIRKGSAPAGRIFDGVDRSVQYVREERKKKIKYCIVCVLSFCYAEQARQTQHIECSQL
jgi:hypothetical protein